MKACDTCRVTETPKWTAYDTNGNRQGSPLNLVVDLCESCAMRWREKREEAWRAFLSRPSAPDITAEEFRRDPFGILPPKANGSPTLPGDGSAET